MNIVIQNQANLSNKYVRFTKWKLRNLSAKFKHLLYAEVFLRTEGNTPKVYQAHLRLGIAGDDIIIKNKSAHLGELFRETYKDAHRYLAKTKTLTNL